MALDALVAVLRANADGEARSLLAAAHEEATAIRSRNEADLAARRAAAREAQAAERRATVQLALVAARHEARSLVFLARERLIARVFAAIRERLPRALEAPGYQALLPGEVAEALRCLGSREGIVAVHPGIAELVQAQLRGRPNVRLQREATVGSGFRVTSTDGQVEIHATLEDRLSRDAPRITLEVLRESERAP